MKTFHKWLTAASLVMLVAAIAPQRTACADGCKEPCWVCCPWKYSPTSCVSTINGPCFGYYPTCWRSWSDACPPCPAPDPATCALPGVENMHEMIPTPLNTAPGPAILEPSARNTPAPAGNEPTEVIPMSATESRAGAFKYSILDIFSPPPSTAPRAQTTVGSASAQRTMTTAARSATATWPNTSAVARTDATSSRGKTAARKVSPRSTVVVDGNSASRTAPQTYAHAPLGFTEKAKPPVYSSLPVFFQKR